jgi:hypothetical protein
VRRVIVGHDEDDVRTIGRGPMLHAQEQERQQHRSYSKTLIHHKDTMDTKECRPILA